MKFFHKYTSYIDLILLNIFFLSSTLLIYLSNYIYQFQLDYSRFLYFNLVNFIILPILFSSYILFDKKIIIKSLLGLNIIILSFFSSRILFFFLLKNDLIIFNKVIFFLGLFLIYLILIYYFFKKVNVKKKFFLTFIYTIILFIQFPYANLENKINKTNLEKKIFKETKPPIFIIALDEVSRKILLDEKNLISSKYPNLRNFSLKNINFTNAQTNYAYSNQIFYSMFTGKPFPVDKNKNYINFWSIEEDANNIFNDFLKLEYDINIYTHLINCKNKKFFCKKPMHHKIPISYLYIKFLSTLIPDNIESLILPFLFQKKNDLNFFQDFNQIQFKDNNLYFFHSLMAHKPWVLDDKLNYIYDLNYKFKKNNKDLAIRNYEMALINLDNNMGSLFQSLKENDIYDNSIIIIMSDHGICFESYCRNRIERLVEYDDYLSNILFLVKYNNLNELYEKRFDIINFRQFIKDLLVIKNFSIDRNYMKYHFYDLKNKPLSKNR